MKQKTLIALICALLFNIVGGVAIAAASGLPVWGVLGGGSVLSMVAGQKGALNMAVQKEIWMDTIVEGLFADDTFISKALNADQFVNMGKSVWIPNAGAPSNVEKNRTSLPATVNKRTDSALKFDLDEYTTDPILIPHADTVELSYSKRESVIRQDRSNLQENIGDAFTVYWAPSAAGNKILTTGAAVAAHTPAATGNRKSFDKKDVHAVMTRFNKDNVPQTGRYMLLDADMYSQLINSLTEKEETAFHNLADIKNGVVGKLYTFNIMMRSKALRYTTAGAIKEWTAAGAAADNAAALAWHENSVCRALGEIVMFDRESDPTYYGDIYSFLIRAAGRPMRSDVKGLIAIVQDTAA